MKIMGIKHDEDECIDLLTVLRVINQISQEQAWAICYEICCLMLRLKPPNCTVIDSLDQIYMHKDGFVHEKSLISSSSTTTTTSTNLQTSASTTTTTTNIINQNAQSTTINHTSPQDNNNHHHHQNHQHQHNHLHKQHEKQHHYSQEHQLSTVTTSTKQPQPPTLSPPTPPITPELGELLKRRPAVNESELVESLGIALFWALDYGIPDDEERKLSIAMEYFIIQAHQSKLSLKEVLEICIKRLPIATRLHADSHYRGVCKALISDTIELSIFLEKIYTASMVLSDITLDNCLEANHNCDISDKDLSELGEPLASLRALRINDWARLWMQVIRELRQRDGMEWNCRSTRSCVLM